MHEDGTIKSSFAKFMTDEEMDNLIKAMDGQPGDLLVFAADKNKIVWNVLGALRLELAEQLDLIDKSKFNFLWVVEFPQFEWSDEQNRFLAMHHPFTMPMDEDLDYIESDPAELGQRLTISYLMVQKSVAAVLESIRQTFRKECLKH